jgi:hypothetical protein
MSNSLPIEIGLLYRPEHLPAECRDLFQSAPFLQYGLPSYHFSTKPRLFLPKMARLYLADYFLLPWEEKVVRGENLYAMLKAQYRDQDDFTQDKYDLQQLVLVEVFDNSSYDGPPYMTLEGYVFLFWSQLLPASSYEDGSDVQEWIDDGNLHDVIRQQLADLRERDRYLKAESTPEPSSSDTADPDDIEF